VNLAKARGEVIFENCLTIHNPIIFLERRKT
jgi:hypothetical protein